MNNEEARAIFDGAAAEAKAQGDLDRVARIELLREYFTSERFRSALGAFTFEATQEAINEDH